MQIYRAVSENGEAVKAIKIPLPGTTRLSSSNQQHTLIVRYWQSRQLDFLKYGVDEAYLLTPYPYGSLPSVSRVRTGPHHSLM